MATQQSLGWVWASTGASTDPGKTNYQQGWLAEIPTFQEFNYVLETVTNNLLVLAESDRFAWDSTIAYKSGARAVSGGKTYYCHSAHTNQDPALDTIRNWWSGAPVLGGIAAVNDKDRGLHLNVLNTGVASGTWSAADITVSNPQPNIALNNTTASQNFLLTNTAGEFCVVDISGATAPNGKNVALDAAGVHRVFHEGHPPVQSEVSGTCPINTNPDNAIYGRQNNSWVKVTSTTVTGAPPPAVSGAGAGWYNLEDGTHYTDINDGDSSQWVPTSPARAPIASRIPYDNTTSGIPATTMQEAIDYLAAL